METGKVLNQPPMNRSETIPAYNPDLDPATGVAKSVIRTGKNSDNNISQPLPEAVSPKIKDGALGAPGTERSPESQVIPTPGA